MLLTIFAKGLHPWCLTGIWTCQLLYIQPLNWIIGIISKNSTTLLSKNIVKVKHLRPQISRLQVELNFCFCKAVTETYVSHRNSGCCLYRIAENWNQNVLSIAPSKLLFVNFKITSFFLQPKRSHRFSMPRCFNPQY